MPRRPSPLPPSLPFDVFTTSEARREGVTTSRLRARDLRRLGYGIYARCAVDLTEIALITALTRNDPMAVARGLSAARHWDFPLPLSSQKWTDAPRITPVTMSTNGQLRRDTTLVRWNRHRLTHDEIVVVGRFRVTCRVRTWLDLAHVLPFDRLVEIGDHLVRIPRSTFENRTQPHTTPQLLRKAVHEYPASGKKLLRQALELIRVGSDSPAETRLRLATARAHLPEPVLNVRQFDQGRNLGEPDLAWPDWRVCIEHDGPRHRTPEQQEKDIARRERREAAGWIEVQTVAADLHEGCERGVRRLREALTRHGWRPPSAIPGLASPGLASPGSLSPIISTPQPASAPFAREDST